jgi:glycopeptide antibiotics resistance protein
MLDMSFKSLYLYSLPLFFVLLLMGKFLMKKSFEYIFFLSIFFFYMISVLKLTLLPIPLESLLANLRLEQNALVLINYKPLWLSEHFSFLLREQLLNVLLLVPFGFLINYLFNDSTNKVIVIGLAFTLTIEFLQLVLCLFIRYPYRIIDINDIIYNFIGSCIGFVFFRLFSLVYVTYVEKYKIKLGPFSQYIFNTGKKYNAS